MEKTKIDMFIGLNAENFHTNDLQMMREKLEKMEDEQFFMVQGTEFQKPSTIFLIAILIGWERFWLEDIALGIVKMATFNGCMIWYIIDILSAKDRAKKYNYKKFLTVCS